jgi:cell division protein FtsZ
MSLFEVNEAASLIHEEAHEEANIIFGAVIDDNIGDEIRVTVIATGFGESEPGMRSKFSSSGAPITAPVQAAMTRPVESTQPSPPPPPPGQSRMFPSKPIRRLGLIEDDSLDIPTFKRRAEEASLSGPARLGNEQADDEDKLDIPTFLRKHLD